MHRQTWSGIFFFGMIIVGMVVVAGAPFVRGRALAAESESGVFHPGCLVGEEASQPWLAPAPPGPPCLPTPPPSNPGATPDPNTPSGPKQGPIRFTINNGSELPFYVRLSGPATYVINVASGESRIFVVTRGVYAFEMVLCGYQSQGAVDLSKFTTMNFVPCTTEKLVKVMVENQAEEQLAVTLQGTRTFVFSVPPGAKLAYTIPRGTYAFFITGCAQRETGNFEAKSNRTLIVHCP